MSVSVYAPGAMIYRETKFQVEKVELIRSDTEGNQAVLSLIYQEAEMENCRRCYRGKNRTPDKD